LLHDYAYRLEDRCRDYLRRIRASAEKMSDIIDDLLLLSRVSLAEIKREAVDLSQIARSIAEDLERRDPSRRVEFRIRPSVVVDADGRLMRVLLTNLVENAWKFTSKTEGATIELGAEDQGDERVVFVRDNGAGFDMTYASKLFHPFQRLHGDAEFPGTGIGLATVRRILERHGGRVWAESGIGRGTTLYFALRPARLDGE
jgi:light-regulated signal transduction histidine kinase (bacteriophytochrome)